LKISADDASILARVFERYMIYAERFLEKGFSTHPENLRNTKLFVETAEDIALVTKLYPAFAGGRPVHEGVQDRVANTQLPDPAKLPVKSQSLLDQYPEGEFNE
jgi:hypothetical protein